MLPKFGTRSHPPSIFKILVFAMWINFRRVRSRLYRSRLCESVFILQHVSSSPRFAHFCTAPHKNSNKSAKWSANLVMFQQNLLGYILTFVNIEHNFLKFEISISSTTFVTLVQFGDFLVFADISTESSCNFWKHWRLMCKLLFCAQVQIPLVYRYHHVSFSYGLANKFQR